MNDSLNECAECSMSLEKLDGNYYEVIRWYKGGGMPSHSLAHIPKTTTVPMQYWERRICVCYECWKKVAPDHYQ